MTVVKPDNTRKILFTTLLAVVLSSLACGQIVKPTPDNTQTATVVNTIVTPAEASTTVAPLTTPGSTQTATVVNAVVNVRAAPDNTSAVVGSLQAGDLVDVLVCAGPWCQIKEPFGWVWRGCLSDNPDGLKCEAKP